MAQIKLQDFAGMIPARDTTLLPEQNAAYSRNAWLYRGNLQGFRTSPSVHTLSNSSAQSVYRVPLGAPFDFANSVWMEFTDPFMDVIRAPVVKDSYKRYYFFSPNTLPQYSPLDDIRANVAKLKLGVPAPTQPPSVSPTPPLIPTSSTTTTTITDPETNVETKTETSSPPLLETRAYVYTWQTIYNEEGPPSPPTTITSEVGSSYTVTLTPPSASDHANRRLSQVNIYRTVSDATGYAQYYLVATQPYSQTAFADNIEDSALVNGTILPSTEFTAPPEGLQGCVSLPNGILAAWTNDREVWFCEPYRPHAWPASYTVSVDYKIVGLGVLGTSLIILTEGNPFVASGVTPSAMSLSRVPLFEPCLSRKSIVSGRDGVYYASQNGLISVALGDSQNITSLLLTRQDWSALDPANLCAARYGSAYMAFRKNADFANGDNGFIIDNSLPNTVFNYLRFGAAVKNVVQDDMTGTTFIVSGNKVYNWDSQETNEQSPYLWRSKVFQFPYKQQFIAGLVYFDKPAWVTIPTPSAATRNTSQTQSFDATKQYLIMRVYADNRLVLVREIQETGEIIQFPSGFKANFWQFEFEGQVVVSNAQIATSVKELGAV